MKILSVPYTKGLISVLTPYTDYINDIYFSDGKFLSARSDVMFNEIDLEEIKLIKSFGIKINYVFNPSFIPNSNLNNFKEIQDYLLSLDYVDIITINNLILSYNKDFILPLKDKFILKNSVNNHIDSVKKAIEICERFDFDNIIIDRSINRDINLIKQITKIIKSYNKTSTILLNEGCLHNCIFKRDCDLTFNISDGNQEIFDCYKQNFKNKNENYLKSPFMVYDSVQLLKEDINIFKISGRYDNPKEIEKRIRYYMFNDRNIHLRELLDKELTRKDILQDITMFELYSMGFDNKIVNCKNDCVNCNHCDLLIEKYKDFKDD